MASTTFADYAALAFWLMAIVAAVVLCLRLEAADRAERERMERKGQPVTFNAKQFEILKSWGYEFEIDGDRNRLIATDRNPNRLIPLRKRVYALHTVPVHVLASI